MKYRGFTLVEMMVVISIIAILAAIAAPSFSTMIDQTRVRKTADFLTQLINTARSEALRRNQTVYLDVTSTTFCIGTTSPCTGDIRSEKIYSGVSVTPIDTSLSFDRVRGLPAASTTYTIKGTAASCKLKVNILGLIQRG